MMRADVLTAATLVATLCSCASAPPRPENVVIGKRAPGNVLQSANDAVPRIVGMAFDRLDVKRGERWSGDFTTSTNTASLEVRTNLFSINVPRTSYGRFHFDVDVLDLPPIFIRTYAVRVIARNAAGVEAEEDVPLRIR